MMGEKPGYPDLTEQQFEQAIMMSGKAIECMFGNARILIIVAVGPGDDINTHPRLGYTSNMGAAFAEAAMRHIITKLPEAKQGHAKSN